jgi:hypothetical protein
MRIGSAFHGIFEGHRMTRKIHKRNLPPAPKRVKDLLTHPFRNEIEEAQHEHLNNAAPGRHPAVVEQALAQGPCSS